MNQEVIVVGGGIIGTACAYFLSRRGVKVLVLERSHLCAGASGSTAAIISISGSSSTPEPLRPLNVESYHLVLDSAEDFDPSPEIARGGALYAAMSEQEAVEIEPFYDDIRKMGIDCTRMNGQEACSFEPLLADHVTAAIFNPASYHVNPFRLGEAYLNGALRRGGRVEYGVKVLDIEVDSGRIAKIITDRGDYHADWVVVAGGAHTPEILSSTDIEIPIVPARGQVILTEPCPPMTERALMFVDHLYTRQAASGNFYLGSHTEFVGFENRITLEKLNAFTQVFTRAVPLFARLRALRFFAGFRPICKDNLPVIGPVPGCPQLIVAAGHGRTGVRFSACTGKAVSELVMDGKTEHPIDAFAVDRFVKS